MMMHAVVAAAFLSAFGSPMPKDMKVDVAAKALISRGKADELVKAAGKVADVKAVNAALAALGRS